MCVKSKLQLGNKGTGMQARIYLTKVKTEFLDKPKVYDEFMNVMKKFHISE